MPKRKRAASEGCCPRSFCLSDSSSTSPVALTRANLELLQRSIAVAEVAMPTASSSSRSASPKRSSTTHDGVRKLENYNIFADVDEALPDELQRFVHDVILKPRDPTSPASPNATKIMQRRRVAANTNEMAGREQLVPYLLFAGEKDLREGVEPVPLITCQPEINLNSFWLPACPNKHVKDTWGPLSQPRPDSCIGYVTRSDASRAGCRGAFSADEEIILDQHVLTKFMYLPFLTGQWKTPIGAEGLLEARCQAARDGATVVTYLHDLYRVANSKEPSPIDTCHFSVIGDVITGQIWIHYRHESTYFMHKLLSFAYDDRHSLERARACLHNIKDHALGARLQSMKDALPAFAIGRKTRNPYPAVAMSETGGPLPALSQSAADSFKAPPTPSSVVSEPTKKRRRVADSGVP